MANQFKADIVDYEMGELDEAQAVEMFQRMINDGSVWAFQGSYGRQAMAFLRSGDCILGERAFKDFYGNRIPSRFEVKAGSMGSAEYQKEMMKRREPCC